AATLAAVPLVRGQLALTQGDFAQAEARFSEAYGLAEEQQEPLLAAEAVLGLAQTRLAHEELAASLDTFLEAGRQFQLLESVDGDGLAVLGVAQVKLAQKVWDEALENCEAALIRFHQCSDFLALADTLLIRGLAHGGKQELDEAFNDFEQALQLYHQQRKPLGVVDARSARAGIFLLRGDVERARDEQTKAITQVERVMHSLSTPQQWSTFLRQYAELYAQTAITDARREQHEQARTLLQNFARIAGSTEVVQYLKAYEGALSTGEAEMSREEVKSNRDLLKQLRQMRQDL
ncbi:MAG: hypothetical protein JO125_16775, partial [Chloroflexi bacterium]|nr:hypothetical protein [Chloroflexota bacterium]